MYIYMCRDEGRPRVYFFIRLSSVHITIRINFNLILCIISVFINIIIGVISVIIIITIIMSSSSSSSSSSIAYY